LKWVILALNAAMLEIEMIKLMVLRIEILSFSFSTIPYLLKTLKEDLKIRKSASIVIILIMGLIQVHWRLITSDG